MRRLLAKVRNFFGRQRAEEEMVREIASHLALLEDEFLRQGMDPQEARLAARRAYGGVEQAKELHRDARSLFWLEQMLQDIRHAYRGLSKSPGFVAVALLSLAFGIGVNTAIFTLVNGILLKKLPVPDPDRIVQLTAHIDKENFHGDGFNFLGYRELRRQTSIFVDVIAFSGGLAALDVGGEPNKIRLEMVTGSYFPFLSARPVLGRLLDEEDDRLESALRVCVLSYQAWRTYFGGDPGVLNRTVRMDGVPLQVVGVAAPKVVGAELQERPDAWVATALTPDFDGHSRNDATMIWLRVMARLRPGISSSEARDRLAAASPSLEDALPKNRANAGVVYRIQDASHGFDAWRTQLRDPLLILMGAVSLVLLVACANLANLLLARANERHQEFAIKLSLGISRWRLLRQLLVETLLLVFGGGVVACFLSVTLTRFLLILFNEGKQYAGLHVAPDTSVVLYAFSACLVTAVVAGLYPAWQASRTDAGPGLKGAALHGNRRSLIRRSLIVVQVALAVVLLFGASLFTHSLRRLKTVNLGYDIDHLLTVAISERRASQTGPPLSHPAFADVLARVRQFPGVESAAFSNPEILSDMKMSGDLTLNEMSRKANEVTFLFVSPGYFATMHMPIFGGRDFAPDDRKGAPPVAIINQRLAFLLSPDRNPIGKHFDGWGNKGVEIVGVTGNSKYECSGRH